MAIFGNSGYTGMTGNTTPSAPQTGGGTSGIIGGIISGVADAANAYTNYKNYEETKKMNNWQKEAWGIQNLREDSAYQRKARDLKLAGLSQTLAAGGSGSSSTPAPILSAPQMEPMPDLGSAVTKALSAMKMEKDIDVADATQKLLAQQTRKAASDVIANDYRNLETISSAHKNYAEAGIKNHDLKIMREDNMPSNPSVFGKAGRDLNSSGSAVMNSAVEKLKYKTTPEKEKASADWLKKTTGMSDVEYKRRKAIFDQRMKEAGRK